MKTKTASLILNVDNAVDGIIHELTTRIQKLEQESESEYGEDSDVIESLEALRDSFVELRESTENLVADAREVLE